MEITNTISDHSNTGKWQCQHGVRWYSKHYKHKLHLTKYIVYPNKCNQAYAVMLQMKDEVKQACIKQFQHMMHDVKQNIPTPPVQSTPVVKQNLRGLLA